MARKIWIAVGVMAISAIFYLLVDPGDSKWVPQCIFYRLTGLQCPGCGAQRMTHALMHGNITEAWGYNAFLLLMLPLLMFMGWLEINRRRYPKLYARIYSTPFIIFIAVAVAGWFILRNFIL